jgi:cobalt-zinc-cadmium efflux system outer membrane protein
VLCALLWCIQAQVHAEANAVTLTEALAAVERSNPEIAAYVQHRRIAAAASLTAAAYPNPELDLGGGPWRSRVSSASGNAQSYGIAQPIELPSVRSARGAVAGYGEVAAAAQYDAVRIMIGFQARQAYYDLLRRQEEERLAHESAALLSEIADRVRKRVAVGEAPRFELVRAEAEALAAQNSAQTVRLRVEDARAVLRRLAGNMLPAQFEARGELPPPADLPPLAELQPLVLKAHPLLRGLEAERERARARLEHERAQRAPQPTLRVIESRDPESRQTLFGVSLPLPLWNRREGQIAHAEASIDLAAAQLETQRGQLLRELDSAYSRLSIVQRQLQTFEAGLLRSAEHALQVAEAAYRFGERGFLEVLDAQRTLRVVRTDYNQARFERYAAWLDIQRLLGRDPFDRSTM